jgi:NAD(P)-dependent dehydrogenase (short-subunit alcohol dehydrogenase family)
MAVADITPLVLVTGPTRGLGKDLALALAKRGCGLVLAGRDETALNQVAELTRKQGSPRVECVPLDLASFAAIRKAVGQLTNRESEGGLGPITAVVANAGIQKTNRSSATVDGLETTFGVNVVGNHLLLMQLEPLLAADAHVVVIGSGTHFGDPLTRRLVAAPVWEDPAFLAEPGRPGSNTAQAGQCAYSTSKLAVNYLVHELNRRWAEPRRANIYDPGLMPGTGLARDYPKFKQWAWNNVMPALTLLPGVATTARSAERLARLTLGEDHPSARNSYIEIGKLSAASKESDNPTREAALWAFCEQITSSNVTTVST